MILLMGAFADESDDFLGFMIMLSLLGLALIAAAFYHHLHKPPNRKR